MNSLRGILAICTITGTCLLAAKLFFAPSPAGPPGPSVHANPSVEISDVVNQPAAEMPSEVDRSRLYMSMESVLSLMIRKQDLLLVDVRGKNAFENYRITGSIRVPLHALRTKTFLKDRRVVLVSQGFPNPLLERTCRDLHAAGFTQTRILRGGLRYWQQKRGPIEGQAFAASEVGRISPMEFFAQQDAGEWLVVAVSPSAAAAGRVRQLIPDSLHLPWEGNPLKFASALQSIAAGRAPSGLRSVLVCDESGTQYEGIEREVPKEDIGAVFYLEGGLQAYQAFLEQQALLRQPRQEEVQRCATCS